MTNLQRRKELKKVLPKKEGTPEEISHLGYGNQRFMTGYNQAIDDCLSAIEDKVVLRDEIIQFVFEARISSNMAVQKMDFYEKKFNITEEDYKRLFGKRQGEK